MKPAKMNYEKLGDHFHSPKLNDLPLCNVTDIKFNYYLSTRVNGNLIDLDITSKLFDQNKMYIRKSCYRVNLVELENCVKLNTIDHMLSLGLAENNIPDSLKNIEVKKRNSNVCKKTVF